MKRGPCQEDQVMTTIIHNETKMRNNVSSLRLFQAPPKKNMNRMQYRVCQMTLSPKNRLNT